MTTSIYKGTVHGKVIRLEEDSGLPEGQEVTITVKPVSKQLSPGEGLRRAAGAWAEDAEELDRFLEWNRQARKANRREIDP